MSDNTPLPLVLASGSRYRQQILNRLGLPFSSKSPDIDETVLAGETPVQLVSRLSLLKAQAVTNEFPAHLIIGSDQVAVLNGSTILGKPGHRDAAIAQLNACNGEVVRFVTGLTVYNSASGEADTIVEPYEVGFRALSADEIASYVDQEQPYDCAGSFKSEGLGISLFEFMRGDDPNSLIGLPVIQLLRLLRKYRVSPLQPRRQLGN